MWLVVLGLLQILFNWLEWGPFAHWTWTVSGDLWLFLWPFLVAMIWWAWADSSGYNARKEMEHLQKRIEERRLQNLENLGMAHKARKKR